MLSGFIFPISSMPAFLQVVTHIVPARYFLVALRGIVLKGVGSVVFWPDVVALAVFAVAILGLASAAAQTAMGVMTRLACTSFARSSWSCGRIRASSASSSSRRSFS